MKKIIAWLLVLSLTAAISIGATLAYLTDTDEDVNVMILGKIKIDQLEYERVDDESKDADATVQEFHDNKPLLPAVTDKNFDYTPGDTYVDWTQIGKDGYTSDIWDPSKINNEVDKMVFIKNKGDYDAFVRTVFAFEAGKYTTLSEFRNMVHLNLNETDYTWEWVETPVEIPNAEGGTTKYFIATATYNKILAPGALTEISLSQIALDKTATNEDVEAFGETYQILVKSQGIQADGFDNAIMALNEGFDMIDASNIPWETDVPTAGATVKNALHYLNADTSDTKITTSVKNVVFGLNQNYADIVNTYEGVLVDIEQDVPVYAYYIPNDNGYDVYLLSNDKIYTPKDSTELFQGMTALVSIDTTNMETGRTEIFTGFLKDCNALTTVTGIENWDTSKATMMDQMFNNCLVLDNLDLKKWNVTNVTNMKNMFRFCYALKNFDASTWYLPNVGDMAQMFLNCQSLEELDINSWRLGKAWRLYATFGSCIRLKTVNVADWDTTSITDMTGAFQFCGSLESIDVSNWDTSNVTSTGHMFRACTSLTELDISNWNVSKITAFNAMFQGNGNNAMDMKIKGLDLSKWQPSSAVHMNHMFYGCAQLTEMDVSGWVMPNLYTTSHMFADCTNLQTIDISGWQTTSSWYSMDGMFNDCRKVQTLDVSSWNTSGVVEFSQLFEACWALQEIKGMENWNTSSGHVFDEMFNGASSLKEVDLSSFDTSSARYSNVLLNGEKNYHGYGNMFNGTKSLQKLILGEKFVFSGDGSIPAANYPKFPNPAAKEGYVAKWQNADTKQLYLASEIPGGVAATYVPNYEYTPKGATMNNALHYLNANPGSTKITTNVTSVTFGLTENYAEIANTYTGVLADQEQENPVYAYYVPNGSNFDVYLLANDDIYLPKDSSSLMAQMTALTKVDTTNLNVSRTENMHRLFYKSGALQTIVGLENWDTGSVTNMLQLFRESGIKGDLDLTAWDVSNVVNMEDLFYKCGNITSLNLENWDTTACTNIGWAFGGASELKSINVSGWDTSNVTLMSSLFYECLKLETLDLTDWDTSKVTDTKYMFIRCRSLKEIVGSGNLNFRNVKNMESMCEGLDVMVTLDVTNWGCDSVTNMKQMFGWALSMEDIIGIENWNVSNVTNMRTMFFCCPTFEELDLSGWNTASLQNTYRMFRDCTGLKTVYVGDGWDMSHVSNAGEMFTNCSNLVGGAGTTFVGTDLKYACVDGGAEAPGYLTYKAPETTNP